MHECEVLVKYSVERTIGFSYWAVEQRILIEPALTEWWCLCTWCFHWRILWVNIFVIVAKESRCLSFFNAWDANGCWHTISAVFGSIIVDRHRVKCTTDSIWCKLCAIRDLGTNWEWSPFDAFRSFCNWISEAIWKESTLLWFCASFASGLYHNAFWVSTVLTSITIYRLSTISSKSNFRSASITIAFFRKTVVVVSAKVSRNLSCSIYWFWLINTLNVTSLKKSNYVLWISWRTDGLATLFTWWTLLDYDICSV